MEVDLNSPVTIQRSPPVSFSPPTTTFNLASSTPSPETSTLPPPAHEEMSSTQPSDPTSVAAMPESIPTATAPASESLTSTAPAVAVSEGAQEPASGQTSTPGQDTPSSEPAETLQERLARAQEQVRELERQIAQASLVPQVTSTDADTTDSQPAQETTTQPDAVDAAAAGQPEATQDPTVQEPAAENAPATDAPEPTSEDVAPPVPSNEQETAPATNDPVTEPSAPNDEQNEHANPETEGDSPAEQADPPAADANPVAPADAENPVPPPPEQPNEDAAADGDNVSAEWADIEEDLSTPDEQEMKEIEARNDIPATDVKFHENSFYADAPEDPEQVPIQKMRLTWVIKGLRGTKEKPNRARILNSPAVQVGGFWWNLKFFPRGNKSPALSAYVNCSRRKPEPDEGLPDHTFTASYGPPDADLGEVKPAVEISTPVEAEHETKEETPETVAEDDDSKKSAETQEAQPEVPENAGTHTEAQQTKVEEEDDDSEDWRVSAQIGIIIYNPFEPRTKTDNAACHQFNKYNEDWGWTTFHGPWSEIHKRKDKQRSPLLQKDTIALDAYVRIFSDPSQALWWHTCNAEDQWNSYSLTGIPAMGTSNYLSSSVAGIIPLLLLAPFRKIFQGVNVEEFRKSSAARPRSLCSQLQMILFLMRKLKKDDRFVSLDSLTELLDKIDESGTDVITFWEAFRRSLELELESEPEAVKQLADIFDAGEGQAVIRWSPVKIPAEGSSSVSNGLKDTLTKSETKQHFPKFFPVEIERQKFDNETRQWKLLYDRVQLDEELDLSPWSLDSDAKYTLYGFVLHTDERNSGNFYSILRPHGPNTKWLAFEDGSPNQVVSYTKHRIQEFEGLEGEALKENIATRATAYIAMYIRTDCLKEYLTETFEPFELSPWLKNCPQISSCVEAKDAGQYDEDVPDEVDIEIYSSDRIKNLPGLFDIHTLKSLTGPGSETRVQHLTVSGETTYQELRHKLAKWNQIDNVEKIKIFIMQPTSPAAPLVCSFKRVAKLYKGVTDVYSSTQPHCLWVRVLDADEAVKQFGDPEPPPDADVFDRSTSETASQVSVALETPPSATQANAENTETAATDAQTANDGESTPVAAAETTSNAAPPVPASAEDSAAVPSEAVDSTEAAVTANTTGATAPATDNPADPATQDASSAPPPDAADQEASTAIPPEPSTEAAEQAENVADPVITEDAPAEQTGGPEAAENGNPAPEVAETGDPAPEVADNDTAAPPADAAPVVVSDHTAQPPSDEAPSNPQVAADAGTEVAEAEHTEDAASPTQAAEVSNDVPLENVQPAADSAVVTTSEAVEQDTAANPSAPDVGSESSNQPAVESSTDAPSQDAAAPPPEDVQPAEESTEPLAGALSAEDDALIAALIQEDLANEGAQAPPPVDTTEIVDAPPADLVVVQTENPPPAPPDATVAPIIEPPLATQETNDDTRSETTDEEEVVTRRPQPFNYGFIQLFDAEKQEFVVHSDFFALRSDDVKEFVRKHLGYAADKTFHIWRRTEAYRLVPVLSSTTFSEIKSSSEYREDGFVLVICEALSDAR